jgi:hypothetical protein
MLDTGWLRIVGIVPSASRLPATSIEQPASFQLNRLAFRPTPDKIARTL